MKLCRDCVYFNGTEPCSNCKELGGRLDLWTKKGTKMNERLEQVRKDIALLREEEKRLSVTYCIGDRFVEDKSGRVYLLAFAGKAFLIEVKDGDWYSYGADIEDPRKITADEFNKVCSNGKFRRIHERK